MLWRRDLPANRRQDAMARAIWTGSIGFGLVNIPVRLYNAVVPQTVRFHEFERETGRRVRHRRVVDGEETEARPARREPEAEPAAAGAAPSRPREPEPTPQAVARPDAEPQAGRWEEDGISYQDVVKGYEVAPGRVVMLTPEELRSLRPERTRTIDIQEFASLDDIDPIYFDRSYYVSPGRGAGAEKPYSLLLRAMQRSRRVGIGSFVLTSRLHLAAIRPRDDVLVLETLSYGDEVRPLSEIGHPSFDEPSDRELDVAIRLIELLETKWDPSRFRDEYRERVLELIGSRAPEAVPAEEMPEREASPGVADLMAALQASVNAARKGSAGRSRSRRRTG
jgi:DNA end-binding protein Ku